MTLSNLDQVTGLVERALNGELRTLEARLSALSSSVNERITELQRTTAESLDGNRKVLDEKLGQTLEEARSGRAELMNAFGAFETKLEQRFTSFDTALGTRFEALQAALTCRLEASSKALLDLLTQAQADAANARAEASQALTAFRTEMAEHLGTVAQESYAPIQLPQQQDAAVTDDVAAVERRLNNTASNFAELDRRIGTLWHWQSPVDIDVKHQ